MTDGDGRHSVIAASLAALPVAASLLATAGCGVPAAPRPAAKPPSDVSVLSSAIAAKKKMIALYTSTIAAHPSLAPQLNSLLRDNDAQLSELERRLIHPAGMPSGTATSRPGATPSAPVAPSRSDAVAALRSAEASAAAVHTRQLLTTAPSLAQLLASIAAAEASHAARLARAAPPRQVPAAEPAMPTGPAGAVRALQAALAAEHAAIYGYGVAGAHLAGRQRSAATRAWNAHRMMRDQVAAMLTAMGAEPVAAADGYQLPLRVHSARTAVSLALQLEDGVTRAYLGLVAVPDTRLRTFGALAMQVSAIRAAGWRGTTVAFPGLPRSALASAVRARGKPGNASSAGSRS